ncbi:alpha/beta fold hydrolase [Xanthobacter variabilis]|uniref:alpha/beta fold hydrolase n=1 Tax=Xanthobacter variabilis TaxID=3119932 RepID=UPI00374E8288
MHPVAYAAERLLEQIPKPRIIETPRGPLACAIGGQGPTLLALHGVMGGLDQSWLLARALLARWEGWRIIAVARPGYPGTPLDTGRTAEEQAEAYASLLATLGVESAYVAAFSGGGPSALAFARNHAAQCRGLVLVSACTGKLEAKPAARAGLAQADFLARLPGIHHVPAWLVRHWPQAAARGFVPDDGQRAQVFADPQAGPLLTALLLSSCLRTDERMPGTLNDVEEFSKLPVRCGQGVSVPVLAVHGTDDGIVPFAHGQEVARTVPGARLLALPHATHMGVFTHMASVRGAVDELLGAVQV